MHRSIRDIEHAGQLILLDDGSKWKINMFDAIHTRLWMRLDRIEASLGKLTNLSRRNQSVSATRTY